MKRKIRDQASLGVIFLVQLSHSIRALKTKIKYNVYPTSITQINQSKQFVLKVMFNLTQIKLELYDEQ